MFLIDIIAGLLVGLTLGLTGGGGSIFAMPFLVYLIGEPPAHAIPISLMTVGLSAASGSFYHLKHKNISWSAVFIIGSTGIVFTPLGATFSHSLSPVLLMTYFGGLMCLVGLALLFRVRKQAKLAALAKESEHSLAPENGTRFSRKQDLWLLLAGSVTGTLTGFLGVGGGFLVVPVLLFATKMPVVRAVGTSLMVIVLVSTAGVLSHLSQIDMSWTLAVLFTSGSLLGMFLATFVARKLSDHHLQRTFAFIIVVLGFSLVLLNGIRLIHS